ncbi:hypothetical protein JYU34_010054 [Plutella xylostella]|uniref:Uncharacterized protein n=1 Tax=Plutella xylostella TaxID=51655 RepID=A0ABQ7QHM3_PLUXY|nr:hypothetical protein JYU34_010054 [Plutella xylostella]
MKRAQCLFSCNSFGDYQFELNKRRVATDYQTRRPLCAARARILKVGEPLVKSNKFLLVFLLVKTLVSLFIFFLSLFNNGLDKIVPMGYQNQINKLPETSFGRTRSLGDMIN